jgi:hypothetical protein
VTSSPAPFDFYVNDAEVDAVRAYIRKGRHGLTSPWMLATGLVWLALGLARVSHVHSVYDFWELLFGAIYLVMAWRPSRYAPAVARPNEMHFLESGLSISFAFSGNVFRSHPWHRIRAIEDAGESFVLVTWLLGHIVLPKQSFPDDGREAWSFITGHGVHGRMPAARIAPI